MDILHGAVHGGNAVPLSVDFLLAGAFAAGFFCLTLINPTRSLPPSSVTNSTGRFAYRRASGQCRIRTPIASSAVVHLKNPLRRERTAARPTSLTYGNMVIFPH